MAPKAANERGAIIIIMSVMMVGLLAATALVVDLGHKRMVRRNLVTATDAGALAAAARLAVGASNSEACDEAAEFVSGTDPDAVMLSGWCVPAPSGSSGVVSVTAQRTIDYAFAPVIGVDDGTSSARTMAQYGIPAYVDGGLRPFGLCIERLRTILDERGYSLPLDDWTDNAIRVLYGKDDQPEACNGDGDIPGNWALIDFNLGNNSTGETADWLQNGYDGPVAVGSESGDCDEDPAYPADPDLEVCYPGDPGAWSNSLRTELDYLITAGPGATPLRFQLPIFDSGDAGGGNAYFHLVGFISAELHGYHAVGSADLRWLDIKLGPAVASGGIGDGTGLDTGTRAIGLCGVEVGNNCS